MPIGEPGWPESACCTASMHSVRIVAIARRSASDAPFVAVRVVVTGMGLLLRIPVRNSVRGCHALQYAAARHPFRAEMGCASARKWRAPTGTTDLCRYEVPPDGVLDQLGVRAQAELLHHAV